MNRILLPGSSRTTLLRGRIGRILRRTVGTALLVVGLLAPAGEAEATHFRYGHLTWRPRPDIHAHTVEFEFSAAFRRTSYRGSGQDGYVVTGDTFDETQSFGGTAIEFGDGEETQGDLTFEVVAYDAAADWVVGRAIGQGRDGILHTYDDDGAFDAKVADCCRLYECAANQSGNVPAAHINNGANFTNYTLNTRVHVGSGNSSPVSSLPPIVNCSPGARCQFTVPASDNESGVTFRMATAVESNVGVQPGAGNGCTGGAATIDSVTGV